MAKGGDKKIKVIFDCDDGTSLAIENVVFKSFDGRPGGLGFLHLENKGGKWFLLQSGNMVLSESLGTVTVSRVHGPKYLPCMHTPDDRPLAITRYTVITTLNGAPFYHIDELDDGTFRLCHSNNFFTGAKWSSTSERGSEHSKITAIRFEAE